MTQFRTIVDRINHLKKEKNVAVLSHYYMPSHLQTHSLDGGIADITGDSLALSLYARDTQSEHILFCGVRFMAETAVIISPEKKVYMPDPTAGCSLASSIHAADIRNLKKQYPGVPVMGYINTYAEAKTEMDICCTSRNALAIIQQLPGNSVIFVPDLYMGQNLQTALKKVSDKKLILWNGTCEVHEQFHNTLFDTADEDAEILLHWEVPESTVGNQLARKKGIVGSTGDILNYVKNSSAKTFMLGSECDLGIALQQQNPDKTFISPCIQCSYMKQNSLEKVLRALERIGTPDEYGHRIELEDDIIAKAAKPVHAMLRFS